MNEIFTIGFTQKTAENFFSILQSNHIDILIDIRLNNTSQLAGFTKYPDIEFFLKKICSIQYLHDLKLAPTEDVLRDYKKKIISWNEYVERFRTEMSLRKIESHIYDNYNQLQQKNICLLCSESRPEHCHRSLVADYFSVIFNCSIINL